MSLSSLRFGYLVVLISGGTGLAEDQKKPEPAATTRIKFQAYDGEPKAPEKMAFQLNTLDIRQPLGFIMLGEKIPGTQYRLKSFVFKEEAGENRSELILEHTVTKATAVLPLNKVATLPK